LVHDSRVTTLLLDFRVVVFQVIAGNTWLIEEIILKQLRISR
jgi:hypothetical protein